MRAALAAALAVLALASPALATPSEELAKAREAFRAGELPAARQLFNDLLYPTPQLASAEDLADAYVALGVCRLATGDEDGARREFEHALQLDPNRQLDRMVITDPHAIQLFDDTKADIRTRGEREANKQREAGERERLRKLRASMIGVRENPYYLNFVPFGFGQLQNGETAKGIAFAATEGVTVVSSVAIWSYLVNKYGISSSSVPLEDGPRVRLLQQLEIGTGIAFFALYVWGAVDARLHYKAQTRVKIDESLLPPELRDVDRPKPAPHASALDRLHLAPLVTPNGAGLGLSWEMP